jgi:hypothetical protein
MTQAVDDDEAATEDSYDDSQLAAAPNFLSGRLDFSNRKFLIECLFSLAAVEI